MIDTPEEPEPPSPYRVHPHVSPPRPSTSKSIEATSSSLNRISTVDSGWDFVDDLPLRWATDYVPLAVPGSRLMNASISTYALWRNDELPRGSALLAVAIKSAVLLYESPKGERAFRFVKVSHIPPAARNHQFTILGILHTPFTPKHHIRLSKRSREPFENRLGVFLPVPRNAFRREAELEFAHGQPPTLPLHCL
jgi:hypothetical protein